MTSKKKARGQQRKAKILVRKEEDKRRNATLLATHVGAGSAEESKWGVSAVEYLFSYVHREVQKD